MFQPLSESKKIALVFINSEKQFDTEIFCDRTKLLQILSNLINNAFKYSEKGTIETDFCLIENTDGKFIRFYVKDMGIGIEKKLQDVIFERFRQVETGLIRNYGGAGLGLSISKAFVKLMGGNIWVESEPTNGATFYFTIPYLPADQKQKIGKTILVAEDEFYNFLVIEELMLQNQIKVLHAFNGKECVDLFLQNQNTIDLVLMDIKMPIMDGYHAAELLKKQNPYLPIIAQSAYALPEEVQKYNHIFDAYITKPINAELLMEKIQIFL